MTAIYLHIPFCERICSYCDFPKKVSKSSEIDQYLSALREEVLMYNVKDEVNSIYIGGGTPSILDDKQFFRLKQIIMLFNQTENCEFTIECNPEHINEEKINIFKQLGVNRISLGVQTFNDRLLRLLNRRHNKKMVYHAVDLLKENGFNNINIDLMFAIPFQTMENVSADLDEIKALNIPHIAYYSLILEEKTVFERLLQDNKITLIDTEMGANMYEYIINYLKENGYIHYEISNFSYDGYQSRHNLVYWHNEHYYGFGMGGSGYIDGIRYYNENRVNRYIAKVKQKELPIKTKDIINYDEQIKETFLLGLRLIYGVSIKEVNEKYRVDILEYFKNEFTHLVIRGLIEIGDRIKLTHTGLFYGNEVFEMFI